MTNHADLIERLQSRTASMYLLEDVKLFHEAADALEAAQAEIEQYRVDCHEAIHERDAALARLAVTEEANSMLLGRNKWLEHVLAVQTSQGLQSVADALTIEQLNDKVARLMAAQPSQAPTCDLRGIDAGPLSEWVDLVRRGYVAKDECLIAVKDVPKWLAQNQPSQADAQDAARYRWLQSNAYVGIAPYPKPHEVWCTKLPNPAGCNSLDAAIDAAINAKESGK